MEEKELIIEKKITRKVESVIKYKANINEYVGYMIAKKRKALKMNQKEFAEKLEITRTSIVNIEKGRQRLSIEKLSKICFILNVKSKHILPF